MFDIGSAVVLGLVLTGLVVLARSLIYGSTSDRVMVVTCLVVSIIAVQLVAASDFASEQVVLDRALNSLNFASQLVVSLLLSGLAATAWQGVKAVRNIGQNDNPPPPPVGP